MKVLYVAGNQDLSGHHGGTIHVLAVTHELLQCGHSVDVVCSANPAGAPEIPQGAGVHLLKRRHPFLLWMARPEIKKLIEELRPDVVIERYYNFAGEAILEAGKAGIPAILEVNSPMIEYPGSWKSRADLLLMGALARKRKRIARAASLILAPLREMIDPAFHEKTRLTEWGVDTELFDPALFPDRELVRLEKSFSPEELLFVHFGSLRKWHGLVTLLEAFDIARKQIPRPCRLIIIGPPPGIQREQVTFAGTIPHIEIPSWLKMCDIAVLPFSIEQHPYLQLGFFWSPLKVFEAMSMELPLITLNHPRLLSLLGVEDPAFFYDGTTEDLAKKMAAMAQQLDGRRQIAGEFRQRVQLLYSWKAHGEQLSQWISEIVKPGVA